MNVRKKIAGRDIFGYLLLALSVVLLCRSLTLCFSNDIWYDELFTIGMAEHSYSELIRFTAADVHPPLYYCIVKLFADLCKLIMPGAGTIIPAKIVSVFPCFVLLLYCLYFIRKRFGIFVSGLFLFCAAAMPQLPAYTVEVRMYGWAMLFVTAAFLHGYGTITAGVKVEGSRHLHAAALVLYGLAAAYTQYFAAVAVGMVYLCVLLVFLKKDRSRIGEWFLWVIVSAVGYMPWLLVLYQQISTVRESYWILPLTWRSLGGCVKFLLKPAFLNDRVNTVLAVILFAAYVAVWGFQAVKLYHNRKENVINVENKMTVLQCGEDEKAERFWTITAGISVLGGLVLFGFVASILIRPIFVYRYMISALGCFWFSFALGLDEILCILKTRIQEQKETSGRHNIGRSRIVYCAGIGLVILILIVGLRDYRAFCGEEEYKTVNMSKTQKALSLIGPQDAVIYNFDQVQAVTAYYLPESVERFLWQADGEKLIQQIISPCGRMDDTDEIVDMLETGGKNIWFIGSFNSRDDIVAEWRDEGLDVEEKGSFLLERYWFNLYRISKVCP